MADLSQDLTAMQHADILSAVSKAIQDSDAERPASLVAEESAILEEVEKQMDRLVAMVRRSAADQVEPYLAQIQEEICDRCPKQLPSGYCPLKSFGECAFYRNARPIIAAIAGVLNKPAIQELVKDERGVSPHTGAVMFHKILIAVDHSEPAEYAARSGMELAKKLGAEVALLTVLPTPPAVIANLREADAKLNEGWDEAKRLLVKCHSQETEGIYVEELISEGSPAGEIVLEARDWHADLVVLGTHNRHGLSRFLLGSTAEAVVRRAPCTVLVVRRPDEQVVRTIEESVTAK
jgi:nucleotide-binding universal stress UspA family protein